MSRQRNISPGHTFVFLGISGSGKGTQAAFLKGTLGPRCRIISTGQIFRRLARRQNLIGRLLNGVLRRGGFMPHWAPAYVWLDDFFRRLQRPDHIIFDGTPRRVEEALLLDGVMRDLGRPLPVALYLRLAPRSARVRLIKRGRADDNPQAIAGRFASFRRHVIPIVRYYQRRGRLITVNGDHSVPAVWRDIKRALKLK